MQSKPFTIAPPEGSFVFIADYENFEIPQNVIVVGIENMENFRYIRRQKKLFHDYFAGTPFEGESWPNFMQSLATELHS